MVDAFLKPAEVLRAYLCWTASSSGVEQNFSKIERNHLERNRGKLSTFVRNCHGLSYKGSEKEEKELIEQARALYALGKGICRERKRKRFDAGVGRSAGGTAGTETAWIRKRRDELDERVAASSALETPQRPTSRTKTVDDLTPDTQKEAQRQQRLFTKRLLEAQEDGLLLPEERMSEKELAKRQKTAAKTDSERIQRLSRARLTLQAASEPKPASWFHDCVMNADVWVSEANEQRFRASLLATGARSVTSDLRGAKIFVVDANDPERKCHMMALLMGGKLLSSNYIQRVGGTMQGVYLICYEAATQLKDTAIHLTRSFQQHHKCMAKIIKFACSDGAMSRWSVTRNARVCDVILCTKGELKAVKKEHKKGTLICTEEEFRQRLASRCFCPSQSGICNN